MLDAAPVHLYGQASLVLSTTLPLLYKLYLEDTTTLNTTGFKLGAYVSVIGWAPVALGYLSYLLNGEDSTALVGLGLNWSLFGTWFLNFYVNYVAVHNALFSYTV